MTTAHLSEVSPPVASSAVRILFLSLFTVLAWAAPFLVLTRVIPELQATYKDFDLNLPSAARLAIAISDLAGEYVKYWYVGVIVMSIVLTVMALFYAITRNRDHRRELATVWVWLLIVTPLVLAVVSFAAAAFPMLVLFSRLSA